MESDKNHNDRFSSSSEYRSAEFIEQKKKSPLHLVKYLLLGLVILTFSFIAAKLFPENPSTPQQNLIERAVQANDDLVPSYESPDPQLLTDFVREQFEWDSGPPFINETALRGVAVHEIVEGLELPSYIYEDAQGGQITVYIISYKLLDERTDNLAIDNSVLMKVSDEYHLVVAPSIPGSQAVMWREYSFLFLAVSSNDTPTLITRINPKRSP